MDQKNEESARPVPPPSRSLKEDIISRIRERDEASATGGGAFRSPGRTPSSPERRGQSGWWFNRPSARQLAAFARQLATLTEVGIPLLRSLQILGERSTTPRLRSTAQDLARRVEEGQPLSTAMSHHPEVFSGMFIGVVRAGEAGGILDSALTRLADTLERRAEVKQRVMSALTYPAITILVEIAVIIIILVYGLPKLVAAYPNKSDLPGTTQALLNTSAWMQANWFFVVILIVIVIVGIWAIFQSIAGRYAIQRGVLSIPIVAGVNRKINVEHFARTLGGLTTAGIPLIDALTVTADSSDNEVVHRTVLDVRDTVEKGGKMEEPLRSRPVFDPLVVDMIMVGDEAGALDTMLLRIADTYESEVDNSLRTLTSIIEPLLIIMLGIAVGFIAVAVFQPYVYMVRNPALNVQ
ncbi:hypothetical protein CVU37_00585 [candidate division BRC1 bacterium HGW-BRC1-1]|jgi:type IV pilus assembly protein PilC|nr:MAG: hypothetical protein CVU37_00585 [candidate division BRC1 bacterium HGW-BRC1-1]